MEACHTTGWYCQTDNVARFELDGYPQVSANLNRPLANCSSIETVEIKPDPRHEHEHLALLRRTGEPELSEVNTHHPRSQWPRQHLEKPSRLSDTMGCYFSLFGIIHQYPGAYMS